MSNTTLNGSQIIDLLRKNNIPVSGIAKGLGVSRAHVYSTIRGRSTSKRIAEAVCKLINLPIQDVFGSKYDSVRCASSSERIDEVAMALKGGCNE